MKIIINNKKRKLFGYCSESGCTGAEIALVGGLLATAAGTGTQLVAGSQEKTNMNNAIESQLQQQNKFQKQGQAVASANEQANAPKAANADIAAGTNSALAEYNKVNVVPVTSAAGNNAISASQNSNNIVGQDANAQVGLGNQAAAPLQGYNDWQVKQWINNLNSNTQLNQIQSNSKNVASLLPLQLQAAQNSESGLSGLGSILSSVGGLASTYGAVGGGLSSLLGNTSKAVAPVTGWGATGFGDFSTANPYINPTSF